MNARLARVLMHGATVLTIVVLGLSPALAAGASVAPPTGSALLYDDALPDNDWQAAADEPPAAMTTPPYEGLTLLSDTTWGIQMWMPDKWQVAQYTYPDGATALVIANPSALDVRFSITSRAIASPMTILDLPAMTAEFDALLTAVPGSYTEWQARWHRGLVRGFEAMSRIKGGDQESQRWLSLRYQGTSRYWIVAEAPSSDDFDANWFAFLVMMVTFRAM